MGDDLRAQRDGGGVVHQLGIEHLARQIHVPRRPAAHRDEVDQHRAVPACGIGLEPGLDPAQAIGLHLVPRRQNTPVSIDAQQAPILQQGFACQVPAHGLADIGLEQFRQTVLPGIGLPDAIGRRQRPGGDLRALFLGHPEQRGGQRGDAVGKPARLAVHQPLGERGAILHRTLIEPGQPAFELIGDPLLHGGNAAGDKAFALRTIARPLRLGPRFGFGIRDRCLLFDHRGDRGALGSRLGRLGRRRAGRRPAPPAEPVIDPLRRRARRKGRELVGAHPHQREAVLAGKLPARTGALVARIRLGHGDPVGRGTRALAFPPDQPLAIVLQGRPQRWLEQLLRRRERALVGCHLLDLLQ